MFQNRSHQENKLMIEMRNNSRFDVRIWLIFTTYSTHSAKMLLQQSYLTAASEAGVQDIFQVFFNPKLFSDTSAETIWPSRLERNTVLKTFCGFIYWKVLENLREWLTFNGVIEDQDIPYVEKYNYLE